MYNYYKHIKATQNEVPSKPHNHKSKQSKLYENYLNRVKSFILVQTESLSKSKQKTKHKTSQFEAFGVKDDIVNKHKRAFTHNKYLPEKERVRSYLADYYKNHLNKHEDEYKKDLLKKACSKPRTAEKQMNTINKTTD